VGMSETPAERYYMSFFANTETHAKLLNRV
jgi:hypothetical protein